MEITIYEDQTGEMQFPEKKSEKDSKIVSFFNNNIDLYVEKIGNNIVIYCHLIAFKASTRPTGYYVVYKDIYSDNIFTDLKKEVGKVLHSLEFQPKSGHQDNIIFENIEKFDDRFRYYKEDTDIVLETIKRGRNLEYSAGDIKEISAFCKDILRNSNNTKISISSTKNNLGNINIIINKKHSESLKRTDSTEQIIGEQREILREKKKTEEGAPGLTKINDAFDRIREGADILKNAGYNNLEIRNEIDKRVNGILIRFPTYTERIEPKKIDKDITIKPEKVEEYEDVEVDKDKTKSHIKILLIIFGIVTIIAAIMVIMANPDILPENIKDMVVKPEPTPIPTEPDTSPMPAVTERTPIPTSTSALVSTNGSETNIPTSEMYIEEPRELKIIDHNPEYAFSSLAGIPTTFNITTNQLANITWHTNNAEEQFNVSTYSATYTITKTSSEWTINATATNANGTVSQEWKLTIR